MPQVLPTESDLPRTVAELGPGVLLFFDRPSSLQTWAEIFGHEWRHAAVTVQTADGVKIANYGPAKMAHLLPLEILHNYRRVGVAKVFNDDAELERLSQWVQDVGAVDGQRYTVTGPLFGPLHLAARRRRPGLVRKLLLGTVWLYCHVLAAYHRDRPAFGCSTYVWAAVHAARSDPLRLPLSAHPDDIAAYATPSTATDELFARWLSGPTELWRAISPSHRGDLDLTKVPELEVERSTVVIDLCTIDATIDLCQDPSVEHERRSQNLRLDAELGLAESRRDHAMLPIDFISVDGPSTQQEVPLHSAAPSDSD